MNSLSKQLAIYGLGGVLNRATGFLLIPLYTSFLTVAEYGMLAILGVLLQLVSFGGLMGIGTACLRFYYEDQADIGYRKRLYGNAAIVLLVWPIILFLGLSLIGSRLPVQKMVGIDFYPFVFLILIIGMFNPLTRLLTGLFRAQRRPAAYISFNLAFFVIQSVIIIYLVALKGQGIYGQVLGQTIANMAMFVLAALFLIRNCTFRFDKALIIKLLKFGIPLVTFFLFAWTNVSTSRFVLQHYLDLESVGIFFLAAQFGGILGLMNTALNNAFTPHFYLAANAPDAAKVLGELVIKYVTCFSLFALLLIAIAPHLVKLVATGEYLDAIRYIALLVLANLLHAFSSPVYWSLTFSKQPAMLSYVRVVATTVLLVLLGILAWLGIISIYSVIVSMIAANILMLVLGTFEAQKHFKLNLDKEKLGWILSMFAILGTLINYITLNIHWVISIPVSFVILLSAVLFGMWMANIRLPSWRFA